jgi:hypothetical protein
MIHALHGADVVTTPDNVREEIVAPIAHVMFRRHIAWK